MNDNGEPPPHPGAPLPAPARPNSGVSAPLPTPARSNPSGEIEAPRARSGPVCPYPCPLRRYQGPAPARSGETEAPRARSGEAEPARARVPAYSGEAEALRARSGEAEPASQPTPARTRPCVPASLL